MDASFDDRFNLAGFIQEQREARMRAEQQSLKALKDALAIDGLELLHGSDCRCAECCDARKKAIP